MQLETEAVAGTFAHSMPWGAEIQRDGRTRFRLWAATQPQLAVALDDGPPRSMEAVGSGWHELTTDQAPPGTHYLYVLGDGTRVPDPASRWQPNDVFGPSVVVDPRAYRWQNPDWKGRPWEEAIWYELHVGAYTAEGTFDALRRKLDYLADLGVTAVELMPIAEFPGQRNWGYDGVQFYAPEAIYGKPDDLKRLIDEAHGRGLMVFLDVVYNHFGPQGNFLSAYAPDFFTADAHTPWGNAINYALQPVRDFAIHNALYWLQEYRFDGLRLDAVDHIVDRGEEHLLKELARTVRETVDPDRHVHLVIENGDNLAHLLERDTDGRSIYYDAQWNDDIHHCYHVLLTGDTGGYYIDYAEDTIDRLGRALCTGFVYQGDSSVYQGGRVRGEKSAHLPLTAFVSFLQNHDQVGNRAFGERIADIVPREAVQAAMAVNLLAPQIPLLFMGEEWGAVQPFYFFTDFHDELAVAVREGRRREFARFPQFADPEALAKIPDPNALSTFEASRLDWSAVALPSGKEWHAFTRELLRLRQSIIVPRLRGMSGYSGEGEIHDRAALRVSWLMGDQSQLTVFANLGDRQCEEMPLPDGDLIFESKPGAFDAEIVNGRLPAWSAFWFLRLPT